MKTGNSAEQQLEEARNEISHLQTQWHEVDNKLQTMIDENEKLKEAIQVHQEAETAAALELESLMNKLDLEYQVRKRAETLAAKMYGENKSWQKQSVMRKKSDGRDSDAKEKALNDALEEVKRLSEELEEEKILNQQKIEELQEIIDSSSDRQDEVDELKRREDQLLFKLRDVTNEKDLLIKKCNQLEDDLVKAKRQPRSLRPAPPPPNIPPPTPIPAPPPPPGVASNGKSLDPLSKLKQLVYQRKAARGALGGKKVNPNERKQVTHGLMVYADAMDEMMQRIKTGNVGLKKVRRYSEIPEGGDYKETEKYGTLGPSASGQFNDGLDDLKEGDVFSALRKGLKPPGTNTLGVSGRKTSEPAVPMHIRQQLRKLHTTDSDDMELEQSNENMLPPSRGLHRNVQCSVRHPKEISPELQKILDAKRAKAKKQQQSVETEESL
nr:shootin-1-like [Ciona intestinalis]|eukprot:XP_026691375.1 shootin-1-like [Ciona intestinalis]